MGLRWGLWRGAAGYKAGAGLWKALCVGCGLYGARGHGQRGHFWTEGWSCSHSCTFWAICKAQLLNDPQGRPQSFEAPTPRAPGGCLDGRFACGC